MNRTFFKMGFGLLVLAGLTLAAAAAMPGTTKHLTGHVPAAVAQLAPVTRLAATNVMQLALSLPVRDQAALDAFQQQLYDPASTNYQKYVTPAQFAAQFGATEADYQAVVAFAQANHLTVTATHPNRLVLDVSGAASDIEAAFQVRLQVYNHPTEARTFFAPATEPVVDASLPVLHVSGLDNYYLPRPKLVPLSQNPNGGTSPKFGSGPGGAYLGTDFRTAYAPGTTLNGAGQNVGLLQFDGFYASDIDAYKTLINLTNGPQVIVVPVNGGVTFPGGGNAEVCLDIEMNLALAPGLGNIYVYEAPNPSPWVDLLSRMANDNLAKQLSCSWGGGPPDAAAEQIFQQMAVQGQSFYNAQGDSDAFVDPINPAQFPEDSPHITQVGGTTLTTGPGSVYASEQVWNWGYPNANGGYWGSSGGISTYYSIPAWQQGFGTPANHGSTTMRNMPDVALTADNVWVTYDNGLSGAFGGTSCAAPLWAAFTALINQQGAINGKPPVGFVNPALYKLAQTSNYTNVFNDITAGDNTWPGSPTNFFAVVGYDLCTGLGTPNGTNLINALVGVGSGVPTGPIITAPLPPWGTNLNVMNGTDPNGPWFLFVQDTRAPYGGVISNGWFVSLTTANPVGFAADNQIYATPTNLTLAVGAHWNFTLSVTNYGPSTSTNVYVTNNLPAGLTLLSSTPTAGTITPVGSTLIWNLNNLPINTGASLALSFTNGLPGVIYTNSAGVASTGTTDPNPDDDSIVATAVFQSGSAPQLKTVSYTPGVGFKFHVTGDPVLTTIQGSTNLITGSWVNLFSGIPPFDYTDPASTNYPMRFYRAVVGP